MAKTVEEIITYNHTEMVLPMDKMKEHGIASYMMLNEINKKGAGIGQPRMIIKYDEVNNRANLKGDRKVFEKKEDEIIDGWENIEKRMKELGL